LAKPTTSELANKIEGSEAPSTMRVNLEGAVEGQRFISSIGK
jgi:hypothetical protein